MNSKENENNRYNNFDLRTQFINNLEKLADNNTREQGYKNLKEIIFNNKFSNDPIRIYLNSLMNFQTTNIKAKEIIIILYAYIGNIYKSNLIDPIDHRSSLISTVNKIINHIRTDKMKSNTYTILKACSYSIIEILGKCMPKNDINNLNKIFIEPFINDIINSSNIYIKNGCCIYINDLIFHIKNGNEFDIEILKCIIYTNKFINNVVLKIKVDFYQNSFLYEAVYNLFSYFNFDYFKNIYIQIIYQMIDILSNTRNRQILKTETIISCMKVLSIIGQKIKKNNIDIKNINKNKNICNDVQNTIKSYVDNRLEGIRKVSRDAAKIWNAVELGDNYCENQNGKKTHKNLFKKMRSLSKNGKVQEFGRFDNMIVDSLQKDIYNNGIGNLLNLSKFIQKHAKKNSQSENKTNLNKKYMKSNTIQKFNYYSNIPIDNNENYSEQNANKEEINNHIQKNNFEIRNDFFSPTNLAPTINNENNEIDLIKNNDFSFNNNLDNKNENNNNDQNFLLNNNNKYSINIGEICDSFEKSKKKFLLFEKKINTKLYHNENKLIQMNNSLNDNKTNIINYQNNILCETIKSYDTITENGNDIDNTLLKTKEFDESGEEYFKVYLKALNLFNNKKYNEAFSLIADDDIYLMRLLFLSREKIDVICSQLEKVLYMKILLKINTISHSHFLRKIKNKLKNIIKANK